MRSRLDDLVAPFSLSLSLIFGKLVLFGEIIDLYGCSGTSLVLGPSLVS